MSLWSEKKHFFSIRAFLLIGILFVLSACAQPISSSWPEVSSGATPRILETTTAYTPTHNNLGERLPSDRFVSNNDIGATFASSSPPGYPQPMEKFLPEHVFNDAETNNNAQLASTIYEPSKPEKAGSFETTEDFIDPVEDWLILDGTTLKQVLSDWSDRAGWRLIWKSERDFKIEAGAMLRGRYIDVSSAIIRNLARARPAPIATFFNGNRVLLIETLEDENAY